jgi:hypothetical protein
MNGNKCSCNEGLNVFISLIGDINYKGNPPDVRAAIARTGKLAKKVVITADVFQATATPSTSTIDL